MFNSAKELYGKIGVDVEKAIELLENIVISVHCWQGDDVSGFEKSEMGLSGGIAATGNYMGRARTADELRSDLDKALSLIPGKHKVNLHAIYLDTDETDGKVERNKLEPRHFSRWVDWAKKNDIGLDMNPTFFSHDKAADGFTLSHHDESIRNFWIEHAICCRKIADYFGKETGKLCVNNIWVQDGNKDFTYDMFSPRERLAQSLDVILKEKLNYSKDAVESKLFGIGSESYVVGSHEFYFGYALDRKNCMMTLDAGHFHPTESIAGKLSSLSLFFDDILLHVSRPVRWDSDHVVALDDELLAIGQQVIRNKSTIHLALDYFDASINRVAAWVIGARNTQKALLRALLEPSEMLKKAELDGDYTSRLAILEELKSYPWQAVWDFYCEKNNVPTKLEWLNEIKRYEREVLSKR